MAPRKKAQHSALGASKADRWLNCPGSVELEAKCPDQTSAYALEGSIAHRVLEKCILADCDAAAFVGRNVLLENGGGGDCTEEMAEAVQVALDEIRRLSALTGAKPQSEQKVHLSWIHGDLWGTCDTIIGEAFGTLYVIDYKHGQGKVVDVDTSQTKFYALGGLGPLPRSGVEDYERVVVGIIQPRAGGDPIRYAEPVTPAELRQWGNDVLKPGVLRTKQKNAPLAAGDWCKFCKAMATCPKIRETAIETAGNVFEEPVVENPDDMTPERLAQVLRVAPLLKDWLKQVSVRAHILSGAGVKIPGLKLVRGKSGNRDWADAQTTGEELELMLGPVVWSKKLESPAQIEKLCKKANIDFGSLAPLITQARGKPTLVKDTDPRSELTNLSAAELFNDTDGED